jgi:hypothetical protein
MKTALLTTLSIAMVFLMAMNAMADNTPEMTIPWSAQQTATGNDYYVASQPTNTAPADKVEPENTSNAIATDTTNEPCEEEPCRWCRCGKLAEPWTLPQPAGLKDRNITVGGWLSGGTYGNQYGNPNNGPIGMRNVGDGLTADQLWIFGERKTDTKGCGWDIGGRVDYMFGADGPDTQAFGERSWDYGWNSSRDYGSAIPECYAEVAYNDVSVKMGRFYTLIGYEVVPVTGNFFYSHSYMMYYAEPFTHTGALASYKRNDKLTLYGGWVNGWDEGWATDDKGSMFIGGATFTFSEKASLTWALTGGEIGNGSAFAGAANGDVYMNSLVFNYKLNDKWTYVLQHDLGVNYDNGAANNQWYGLSNYLFRKLNDCWSVGGRIEWFQDPQGARVGNGCLGNYYEATVGFNYKPHANFTLRPELRYDWFNGFAGNTSSPFSDGTKDTQLSGGLDAIFTF